MAKAEQRSPFAPAPLQDLPRYYELLRPCAPHRYSDPRGLSRLRSLPLHRRTGSHVPYKSLVELRAADRSEEQMLAISAWVALKEGARDQALKFMRAAADGEDGSVKNVSMENRLYPMRELLAELLMEMGQAAPALREYRAALKENPNRYRGLYGAAKAAEAAGDRRMAADYFAKLVVLSKNADTVRPELAGAKAYLAQL